MSEHPFKCTCRFNENGDTTCGMHEPKVIFYYDRETI